MMSRPTMRLAVQRWDRSAALVDGRIPLDSVLVIRAPGGRTTVKGLLSGAFDAAEIPLANYVFWKEQGEPVTAVPVFTDRLFTYPYMYTRSDTGIANLADLRGRRVAVTPGYYSTPMFWHRAILEGEYGIVPTEIDWYATTAESDARMRLPEGVSVTIRRASILGLELLLDGTVDCLLAARTPYIPPGERHRVRRLVSDAHARQREWYRRTGFFPILHLVIIRDDAFAKRPEFGEEICRAYDAAKRAAYHILQDERMTALPFMRAFLDETTELCGDDPWPFGLERNRAVLVRFLECAQSQGLTRRRLTIEELFDERAAGYQFTSRMVPGSIVGFAEGGWADESVGLE